VRPAHATLSLAASSLASSCHRLLVHSRPPLPLPLCCPNLQAGLCQLSADGLPHRGNCCGVYPG